MCVNLCVDMAERNTRGWVGVVDRLQPVLANEYWPCLFHVGTRVYAHLQGAQPQDEYNGVRSGAGGRHGARDLRGRQKERSKPAQFAADASVTMCSRKAPSLENMWHRQVYSYAQHMSIDIGTDMPTDMCIGMCAYMCMDMCIGMSIDI